MDKQFIQSEKQEIQNKYSKAQQKWIQMAELAGKEYVDFQVTLQGLQKELQVLEAKEKEGVNTTKKTGEPAKTAPTKK